VNPGCHGHGAGTPLALASWWTRYLVPKDESSVVCDPFLGSGTMALAALAHGASFVGGDKMPEYVSIARRRIDAALAETPLLA
jgi:DNA modification methylase